MIIDNISSLITSLLDKSLESFYTSEVGTITSISSAGIFVKLEKKVFINNKYVDLPIISCQVMTNNNSSNGFKFDYEVGNKVIVLFLDSNYSNFIKNNQSVIQDREGNLQKRKTMNYAIILGLASQYIKDNIIGFFASNMKVEINKSSQIISISNGSNTIEISSSKISSKTAGMTFELESVLGTFKNTTTSLKTILDTFVLVQNSINTNLLSIVAILVDEVNKIQSLQTAVGGFTNANILDDTKTNLQSASGLLGANTALITLNTVNISTLLKE